MKTFENKYFASCPSGLEPLMFQEILSCQGKELFLGPGGVEFSADKDPLLDFLFQSRVANRLYQKLCTFFIKHPREIPALVAKHRWKDFFSPEKTIKVISVLQKNEFYSQHSLFQNGVYLSQLIKDGVVDHFTKHVKKRPSIDLASPDILIYLHCQYKKDFVEMSLLLDLSGPPLYERGFRGRGFRAPMKENLAAGIILSTDWKKEDEPFIDSMCGSGTLLIEAALIKGDIPPSYQRIKAKLKYPKDIQWGLEHLHTFQKDEQWNQAFKEALQKHEEKVQQGFQSLQDFSQKGKKGAHLFGYEIDAKAVDLAQQTIEMAGLKPFIQIEKKSALKLTPPPTFSSGVILCNPPYGKRMGDLTQLSELYFQYGENLKQNFKNYRAYIFTGNLELRKKISLKTTERKIFYNGPIECRLLKYELF